MLVHFKIFPNITSTYALQPHAYQIIFIHSILTSLLHYHYCNSITALSLLHYHYCIKSSFCVSRYFSQNHWRASSVSNSLIAISLQPRTSALFILKHELFQLIFCTSLGFRTNFFSIVWLLYFIMVSILTVLAFFFVLTAKVFTPNGHINKHR